MKVNELAKLLADCDKDAYIIFKDLDDKEYEFNCMLTEKPINCFKCGYSTYMDVVIEINTKESK